MKTINLAAAKSKLSEIVNLAEYAGERIVIEKRKTPAVVILGYAEYKRLEELEDIYDSMELEKVMKSDSFHDTEEVAGRLNIEL
ncbi:MAG: type II toxin-antitoxin system prevent-host-death family antitoxin [Syntrophus sp. (in: bacteria)]|nr:type II toxin-antitoxin system prevent-host-death family antitoxin [Syntrophus sp. (in: bacteria)]